MMLNVFKIGILSIVVAFAPLSGVAKPVTSSEEFSTQFFQQIAKKKPKANFVLSGESLKTVLLMLQDGATGLTQRELSQALCGSPQPCQTLPDTRQKGYQSANAMWVQKGLAINPDYQKNIQTVYQGEVASVDFQKAKPQAVDQINAWTKKHTGGMIPEILKANDVDSSTALVLTNALYFQGFWPTEFDPKKTVNRPFILLNGETIEVPTMIKNDNYFMAKNNDIQMAGLTYRDSSLELLILMPTDTNNFGKFVATLTNEKIQGLVAAQQQTKLTLFLPKFSITSSYDSLKSNLEALGIHKVFSATAELGKINDKAPLYLSKVLQKAIIEVDEKGTKAAAVTAGIVAVRASLPALLQVNHPFVFALYDQKSKNVIFMGQVVNPLATAK